MSGPDASKKIGTVKSRVQKIEENGKENRTSSSTNFSGSKVIYKKTGTKEKKHSVAEHGLRSLPNKSPVVPITLISESMPNTLEKSTTPASITNGPAEPSQTREHIIDLTAFLNETTSSSSSEENAAAAGVKSLPPVDPKHVDRNFYEALTNIFATFIAKKVDDFRKRNAFRGDDWLDGILPADALVGYLNRNESVEEFIKELVKADKPGLVWGKGINGIAMLVAKSHSLEANDRLGTPIPQRDLHEDVRVFNDLSSDLRQQWDAFLNFRDPDLQEQETQIEASFYGLVPRLFLYIARSEVWAGEYVSGETLQKIVMLVQRNGPSILNNVDVLIENVRNILESDGIQLELNADINKHADLNLLISLIWTFPDFKFQFICESAEIYDCDKMFILGRAFPSIGQGEFDEGMSLDKEDFSRLVALGSKLPGLSYESAKRTIEKFNKSDNDQFSCVVALAKLFPIENFDSSVDAVIRNDLRLEDAELLKKEFRDFDITDFNSSWFFPGRRIKGPDAAGIVKFKNMVLPEGELGFIEAARLYFICTDGVGVDPQLVAAAMRVFTSPAKGYSLEDIAMELVRLPGIQEKHLKPLWDLSGQDLYILRYLFDEISKLKVDVDYLVSLIKVLPDVSSSTLLGTLKRHNNKQYDVAQVVEIKKNIQSASFPEIYDALALLNSSEFNEVYRLHDMLPDASLGSLAKLVKDNTAVYDVELFRLIRRCVPGVSIESIRQNLDALGNVDVSRAKRLLKSDIRLSRGSSLFELLELESKLSEKFGDDVFFQFLQLFGGVNGDELVSLYENLKFDDIQVIREFKQIFPNATASDAKTYLQYGFRGDLESLSRIVADGKVSYMVAMDFLTANPGVDVSKAKRYCELVSPIWMYGELSATVFWRTISQIDIGLLEAHVGKFGNEGLESLVIYWNNTPDPDLIRVRALKDIIAEYEKPSNLLQTRYYGREWEEIIWALIIYPSLDLKVVSEVKSRFPNLGFWTVIHYSGNSTMEDISKLDKIAKSRKREDTIRSLASRSKDTLFAGRDARPIIDRAKSVISALRECSEKFRRENDIDDTSCIEITRAFIDDLCRYEDIDDLAADKIVSIFRKHVKNI